MNKSGMTSQQLFWAFVSVAVLVVVVLFLFVQGGKFAFFFELFPSFNQTITEGDSILGYNLLEGELFYYTGTKWKKIIPPARVVDESQEKFVLGNYEFNPGEVKRDFEDFYYENREVPFEIKGAGPENIIHDNINDNWLKQSSISNLEKSSLGASYPENLQNQHGVVLGSLKILEEFNYVQRFFLVTQKNEFYKTGESDEFMKIGKLSRSVIESPMDDDWYLSDRIFMVSFFQGTIFENSKMDEVVSLIQGNLLELNNFYLDDDFGSPGEKIEEVYIQSEDGVKWIYYGNERMNVYIEGDEIYALAERKNSFCCWSY